MIDEKKLIRELEDMIGMLPTCYLGKQNEHDAYWDGFFRALSAVKRQPRAGEWIPVEEGLPNIYKNVQITYLSYYDDTPCDDGVAYIDDCGVWHWEFDDSSVSVAITAWRPLPKPYVKGDVEE